LLLNRFVIGPEKGWRRERGRERGGRERETERGSEGERVNVIGCKLFAGKGKFKDSRSSSEKSL
jgi:hypothetical protein